jgi:hypothetical protein
MSEDAITDLQHHDGGHHHNNIEHNHINISMNGTSEINSTDSNMTKDTKASSDADSNVNANAHVMIESLQQQIQQLQQQLLEFKQRQQQQRQEQEQQDNVSNDDANDSFNVNVNAKAAPSSANGSAIALNGVGRVTSTIDDVNLYRSELIGLCRNEAINDLIGSILDMLKPSRRAESQRLELVAFVRCLVRRSLGAQLYTVCIDIDINMNITLRQYNTS